MNVVFFKWNLTKSFFLCRMVIEEREREHEEFDRVVHGDLVSQQALKMCGIYRFWNIGSIRAQPILLQMLINYWYPDIEALNLDGKPLKIEVDDIYFITKLSHLGEVVNIGARGAGERMTIDEYIAMYFIPYTRKVGIQVPI